MAEISLFPHQIDGVRFLKSHPRALLADEMGLGKTLQAIEALRGISPVLILAPASLMGVWQREFASWEPDREVVLLSGTRSQRVQQLRMKGEVFLLNYEMVAKLLSELMSIPWAAFVLDEAHRVKNRKAQSTKAVQSLTRKYPSARIVELTGTPILNRPDDLWSLLNILDPKTFSSYWRFVEKYCYVSWNGFGWEVGGPRNLHSLKQDLSKYYLRREKSEVLKDLPSKIITPVWVDLEGEQLRLYREMSRELRVLLESGVEVSAMAAISQLLRLRQICIDPNILTPENSQPLSGVKARALLDLLSGSSSKVVIFSQWERVVEATSKLLSRQKISHLVLTGKTPQATRSLVVERFQSGSEQVLLATIGAAGVGITLTAADTAIFLDKDWTPALNLQAQDRLHRIGQRSVVWVYEILVRKSVEEYVERLLQTKMSWSESLLSREVLGHILEDLDSPES